ncbi:MAG: polysaccharide biosynthesis protein [Lachnospiraceae bacterium]|nr:polysaccharide biosynthesis protein [Lachnospiraceae bacterium]
MSKNNSMQLKIGAILSYIQMAAQIIMGLIYTPLMLRLLGQSEYGLYNTVSSTISMLSILSLGFNSSYIRYYARYKKSDDDDNIAKLNGLYLIIFSVIGCVAFACGMFFQQNPYLIFADGLTASEYSTAKILMLLLTINLSLSFPMCVFTSIISAQERFVFLKLMGLVTTLAGPLITLPLLLMGYRSIAVVGVTVTLALATYIVNAYYSVVKLQTKFKFHGFENGLFRNLFIYTSFIALELIVDQVNWNIDKILLGRFRGTSAVAIYSVGYSLYSYYQTFSCSISGVFTARVHRIFNETKDDIALQRVRLTELFTRIGRLQFLVLALVASGLVFFGKQFITIWAGRDYADSYYVSLLLAIPASIALIQNLGIEIQRAENRHQFRSIAYFVMACINLGMSIVFCQLYGAIGAALGTALALIFINGLVMNIYYHKKCNIDILYFWKDILSMAKGMIGPITLGILMNAFVDLYRVIYLLPAIALYSAVYCVSMYVLGMNDYERQLLTGPVKKVLGN